MNLQKSYKLATCRFGYLSEPQNVKERKREKLSRQFLYKMNEESNTKVCYVLSAKVCREAPRESCRDSQESKNVVQRESYVGGRVLQLCTEQKCCREQQKVSNGSATQEEE